MNATGRDEEQRGLITGVVDGKPGLEPDHKLIFDIEYLSCAESVHAIANLVGAYRTAIEIHNEGSGRDFHEIAVESERCLRALLVELRLKKAMDFNWDRCLRGA